MHQIPSDEIEFGKLWGYITVIAVILTSKMPRRSKGRRKHRESEIASTESIVASPAGSVPHRSQAAARIQKRNDTSTPSGLSSGSNAKAVIIAAKLNQKCAAMGLDKRCLSRWYMCPR